MRAQADPRPHQQDWSLLSQIYNSVSQFCQETLQDKTLQSLFQEKFMERLGPIKEISLDNSLKESGRVLSEDGMAVEKWGVMGRERWPLQGEVAEGGVQGGSLQNIIGVYNQTRWNQSIINTLKAQEQKTLAKQVAQHSPIQNRQPNMQRMVRHLGKRKNRKSLRRLEGIQVTHQMKLLTKVYGHRWEQEDMNESEQSSAISNVRFDQKGEMLLTGDCKGLLKAWHVPTARLIYQWKLHNDEINDLDISSCNRYLASVSDDGQLKVVDFHEKKELCVLEEHTKLVVCKWVQVMGKQVVVAISENSSLIALEETQFSVPTHQLNTLKINLVNILVEQKRQLSRKQKLSGMDVNSRGQMVVGTSNGDVIVFAPLGEQRHVIDSTCNLDYQIWSAHKSNAHLVLWANHQEMLVTGSLVGGAKVWQRHQGVFKEVGHIQYEEQQHQANDYKCWAVCWSAKYNYVVVSLSKRIREAEEPDSHKSIVKVYSIKQATTTHTLDLIDVTQWILIVECHPTQEHICVAADLEGNVIIWDIVLGVALNVFRETADHVSLPAHPNLIYDGRFSPDGRLFVVSTFYGSFSLYGNHDPAFYQHSYAHQFLQEENDSSGEFLCDANHTPYPFVYDPPPVLSCDLPVLHRHLFLLYDYNSQISRRIASDKKQQMVKMAWLIQQHSRVYNRLASVAAQRMVQVDTLHGHALWLLTDQPLPNLPPQTLPYKRLLRTSAIPDEPIRRRRPVVVSPPVQSPRRSLRQPQERPDSPDDHQDSSQSRTFRFLKRQEMRDQSELVDEPSTRRSMRVQGRVHIDSDSEDQEQRRNQRRSRQNRIRRALVSPEQESSLSSAQDSPEKRLKREVQCIRCDLVIKEQEEQCCENGCGRAFHRECFQKQCLVNNEQSWCLKCLQQKQGRLNRRVEETIQRRDFLRSKLQSHKAQQQYSEWLPQVDDQVYFLFQPYETTIQKHFYYLDHLNLDLCPHNSISCLRDTPCCEVVSMAYSFTKTPPKKYLDPSIMSQVFLVLTLSHAAGQFQVVFLPYLADGCPSSLVPKSLYDQAQNKYSNLVSLETIQSTSHSTQPLLFLHYSPLEKYLPTDYLSIHLQCTSTQQDDQPRRNLRRGRDEAQRLCVSKWDLVEDGSIQGGLETTLQQNLLQVLENFVEGQQERAFFCEFVQPVDIREYPSYLNVVHVQFYIQGILKRLRQHYYRSINHLVHEIDMIYQNVSTFNERHSPISCHGLAIVKELKKVVMQVEDSQRASNISQFLRTPMTRSTRRSLPYEP